MTAIEWLPILTLGAMAGAAGQAARTIPGLKKLSDEAAAMGTTTAALLVPSQLVTSLMIGAVAGLLGSISLQSTSGLEKAMDFGPKDLLMLAAIGYAGADFIEAFVQKQFPNRQPGGAMVSTAGPASGAVGALPANTQGSGALIAGELAPNADTRLAQVNIPGLPDASLPPAVG